MISYIEVPVNCPELKKSLSSPKIYEIQSDPIQIKTQLQGNTLRIKAENKGNSNKESVVEKIFTVDNIHYYFGWGYIRWGYKGLFVRFFNKLLFQ